MDSKIKIPREMLMHIDFTNSINGGMSEPVVHLEKGTDGYQVTVKAPGIDSHDLELEIVKNKMRLYHLLPIFAQNEDSEEQWKTIRFISTLTIPDGVDADNITARYDESKRQLVLFLPFNHQQDDFRRKVDIERW
ncbi:Molecular chaperone IbpA, HSP20 family [Dyadobacter koreensis]|uniref:Molecular chaperone IbpA, HSP20 family n=1 Tax=Dyadobacter koreensis TaxID=408657 RepID=A0A1H6ZAU4_9BACT|nr:Hsp20/alpha crystallin family protein [Dyadobacter koreensis]SEJ46680.1 Molecular chaperone IbpA, HSP20 family [Dyadobacter koreensis]